MMKLWLNALNYNDIPVNGLNSFQSWDRYVSQRLSWNMENILIAFMEPWNNSSEKTDD